jgi:pilus assembly protein CpaF
MFGRRNGLTTDLIEQPVAAAPLPPSPKPQNAAPTPTRKEPAITAKPTHADQSVVKLYEVAKTDRFYDLKKQIFSALLDIIDAAQLAKLDNESARAEIRGLSNEIIAAKRVVISKAEQEELFRDICNDMLGYGPLEPLLARDDIADIMVNGSNRIFIEVGGKIRLTDIRFRDNAQLLSVCQRIASQVGRRVDESSPICDARLPDGSRINVIIPPLAIDGPTLTVRKFKKDKLTLNHLVKFGAISPDGAEILQIISRVRCNVVISGGTGSGKTTLLNCMCSSSRTWCGSRHARRTLRARGKSQCAISSAIACACGPNGSSSARCAAPRPLTCYRP